jgi:hypothetical protein
MATVFSMLPAAEAQIRGPALIGPGLHVRGPGVFTAHCPNAMDDFIAEFTNAINLVAGPPGILMAEDTLEIQQLSTRWAVHSEPGWLVGTQTNTAELQLAFDQAGDGNPLRILIARTWPDVMTLSTKWQGCP